jgi:5-hydroxyisourate hydrolase
MSEITTHVLDTSLGRPAAGVPVALEIQAGNTWKEISRGATDADGRLRHLLEPGTLTEAVYRLSFETETYFRSRKIRSLYPKITIAFQVTDKNDRYHIPLLLSPYGYSTYRGS